MVSLARNCLAGRRVLNCKILGGEGRSSLLKPHVAGDISTGRTKNQKDYNFGCKLMPLSTQFTQLVSGVDLQREGGKA
jgi:hypothetical protein